MSGCPDVRILRCPRSDLTLTYRLFVRKNCRAEYIQWMLMNPRPTAVDPTRLCRSGVFLNPYKFPFPSKTIGFPAPPALPMVIDSLNRWSGHSPEEK